MCGLVDWLSTHWLVGEGDGFKNGERWKATDWHHDFGGWQLAFCLPSCTCLGFVGKAGGGVLTTTRLLCSSQPPMQRLSVDGLRRLHRRVLPFALQFL